MTADTLDPMHFFQMSARQASNVSAMRRLVASLYNVSSFAQDLLQDLSNVNVAYQSA